MYLKISELKRCEINHAEVCQIKYNTGFIEFGKDKSNFFSHWHTIIIKTNLSY